MDHLKTLEADNQMAARHRLHASRAHLLEMAGDHDLALAHYRAAARRSTSLPGHRYFDARGACLTEADQ